MAMLEKIHSPEDIKGFDGEELESLCEEMRRVIIDTVSANGGHLASNLGVVELTVALGLAFSPPRDTIVWDVGHQSYPYKLLTGQGGTLEPVVDTSTQIVNRGNLFSLDSQKALFAFEQQPG